MRIPIIAVVAATMAVGPLGSALAILSANGSGDNGTRINGGYGQGTQGVNPIGVPDATVVVSELPAPVAR